MLKINKKMKHLRKFNEDVDFRGNEINTISDFIGETPYKVDLTEDRRILTFYMESGKVFKMMSDEDCSYIRLYDIIGDLSDLEHSKILKATEDINNEALGFESDDSYTWTFYNFATMKGYVTLRWLGESNGYYSETVDISIQDDEPWWDWPSFN